MGEYPPRQLGEPPWATKLPVVPVMQAVIDKVMLFAICFDRRDLKPGEFLARYIKANDREILQGLKAEDITNTPNHMVGSAPCSNCMLSRLRNRETSECRRDDQCPYSAYYNHGRLRSSVFKMDAAV